MLSNAEIYQAIQVMRREYPDAGTTLTADTHFHFLLAVILFCIINLSDSKRVV